MSATTPVPLSSSRLNHDYQFGGTVSKGVLSSQPVEYQGFPLDYWSDYGGEAASPTVVTDSTYRLRPCLSTRSSSISRDLFSIPAEQLFGLRRDTWWVTGGFAAETDPKGALLSQLAEYQNLSDDWDGYGGKAASIETVMDSVHFLRQLPSTFPLPKSMISGSGVIGLYWEGNGCYASIDFDGSGYYCYIADCGDEEAGEDKVPVAQALPQRLLEVIAMTADEFLTVTGCREVFQEAGVPNDRYRRMSESGPECSCESESVSTHSPKGP